jgi:hypothetical protein
LLVYRRALPLRQRAETTFITATTMPLLIALAAIGLSTGVMIPANAAARAAGEPSVAHESDGADDYGAPPAG